MSEPEILGRQSSHYTRVARIFAIELQVPVRLTAVHDLMSLDPAAFGGNPALKLPILRIDGEAVFGSANICRALARRAGAEAKVYWPEDADCALSMNAHEMLAHAMAAQVEVVMHELVAQRPPDLPSRKRRQGLVASLEWLDRNLEGIHASIPDARLRWFDVALFCMVEHLPFRNPIDLSAMPALTTFAQRFGQRDSAQATPYRFDSPPPCP